MSIEVQEVTEVKTPRVIKNIKTVYTNMCDRLKQNPELNNDVEFMGALERIRGLAQDARKQEGQHV